MSNDGILRTHALDQIITEASQGETIGENILRMKAAMREALANMPAAELAAVPMPAPQTFAFEREIRWDESLHRRPLVIRANSQAELDDLENQILYGGRQ